MTDPSSETGEAFVSDTATDDTQTAQNDFHDTGSDTPVAPSASGSLRDQADVSAVDLWQYQDQLDTIILSYYSGDYDNVISQFEILVTDLYADEALMQIEGEDYADFDVMPRNFWHMNLISTLRVRLAYRDRILQQRLGSYASYQRLIINSLGFDLTPTEPNHESGLYRYATGSAEERDNDYCFALTDILCNLHGAFDAADGFTAPQEAEE